MFALGDFLGGGPHLTGGAGLVSTPHAPSELPDREGQSSFSLKPIIKMDDCSLCVEMAVLDVSIMEYGPDTLVIRTPSCNQDALL